MHKPLRPSRFESWPLIFSSCFGIGGLAISYEVVITATPQKTLLFIVAVGGRCIFTAVPYRIGVYVYAFLLPYPIVSVFICMHFYCRTLSYRCLFVCIFTAVPYRISVYLYAFLLPYPMSPGLFFLKLLRIV